MLQVLDLPSLVIDRGGRIFIEGRSSGQEHLLSLLAGSSCPSAVKSRCWVSAWTGWVAQRTTTFGHTGIGFVFQMFQPHTHLSVVENVLLPCRFSRSSGACARYDADSLKPKALRLLRQLDMTDATLLRRPVTSLSVVSSSGWAAARALIGAPAPLIADRPTSSRIQIGAGPSSRLLFDNARAGSTLVFVSHDASLNRCSTARCACRQTNRSAAAAARRAEDATPDTGLEGLLSRRAAALLTLLSISFSVLLLVESVERLRTGAREEVLPTPSRALT